MGGKCSALLQLYLSSITIISAVLTIQTLPNESSDWCAKDNATGYVTVPPVPVSSQLDPFPDFNCAPMTEEECDNMGLLMIPECIGKSVVDLNLKHPKRGENARMFRNISLGIPTIRSDRAVSFGIWDLHLLVSSIAIGIDFNIVDENKFLSQALNPIRKNIIEFTLYSCHNRCPGKLPALKLTSLLSFSVQGCDYSNRKPVVFRRGDFVHNIRLRAVIADQCFWLEIERFTFSNLPDLRLVALEKDFFRSPTSHWLNDFDNKVVSQLKKMHCQCDLAWLRDLYRVNPELVSAKLPGRIYGVCDAVSPAFKNKDIYVPVNCSKEVTADESNYDWKRGFFGDFPKFVDIDEDTYKLFSACVTGRFEYCLSGVLRRQRQMLMRF